MPRSFQLSLLGTGQGKGFLFGKGVLEKYLDQHNSTPIPNEMQLATQINIWLESLQNTDALEAALEQQFVHTILCNVLGYLPFPTPAGRIASVYTKPGSRVTGIRGVPDAALGQFSTSNNIFTVAVELKSPGADLDEPQPSYEYRTPVEQGFGYGRRMLGVRWVLVSDMRILRLYSVENAEEYEEVDLQRCVKDGRSTAEFRKLLFLFHHDYLVKNHEKSQVASLYAKSSDRQIQIRDGFYTAYYWIRAKLYEEIKRSSTSLTPIPDEDELLEATQRLLDRMLFLYYCEDHPQQLIPDGTVNALTEAARNLPGQTGSRVYEFLKNLFREIDTGSPPESGLRVAAYNGELFKPHRIIDAIDLPDSLHDIRFPVPGPQGERIIRGVWGLHVFDFWSELNEHLLGHIFEESLSDLKDLTEVQPSHLADKMRERKAGGIFFTSSILADFLCGSILQANLNEDAPIQGETPTELISALENRIEQLLQYRAIDFACGSGAFLTALYRELQQEFWRLHSSLATLNQRSRITEVDLLTAADVVQQSRLLQRCVYGVDRLPQAVEIAKLAIWLRSARKDEKVLDLSSNLIAADSLLLPAVFERLGRDEGVFDFVVGNPPWGGEVDPESYGAALAYLGLPADDSWDSWELFLLLAIRALREGGRLALVLPDSFFYPQKARLRHLLFGMVQVEKAYNLGPDWFGPNVRMGTMVLQARRGRINRGANIRSVMLAGSLRQQAIRGHIPLSQVESQRSREIPLSRVLDSEAREVEVFRGVRDDAIMQTMESRSVRLGGANGICEWARGEEINKAGLLWICPSCLNPTTPGKKKKGGGFEKKNCETCGHKLSHQTVDCANLVVGIRPSDECAPFIDGDDINRRYTRVTPNKWLRLGVSGWNYKNPEKYRSPKILLRQAGVGICATIDLLNAWYPQSVYMYRITADMQAAGYEHEFVLGVLLSRTLAYYVFKRFGEVDPAKAHAKMTHSRLASLPIPVVDFRDSNQHELHNRVVQLVQRLLNGDATIGGTEDLEIEQILRRLWGVSSDDGAFINAEFYDLPASQIVTDLFPHGRPQFAATAGDTM